MEKLQRKLNKRLNTLEKIKLTINWSDKYLIVNLIEKGQIHLASLNFKDTDDLNNAITAATEFLNATYNIVIEFDNEKAKDNNEMINKDNVNDYLNSFKSEEK